MTLGAAALASGCLALGMCANAARPLITQDTPIDGKVVERALTQVLLTASDERREKLMVLIIMMVLKYRNKRRYISLDN